MTDFTIKNNWISSNTKPTDELAATFARLQILLGNRNITEHRAPHSKTEVALQIPVYYLAEWIAENWWVVLFEPRKDEDTDDSDFTARHSIMAAQHGFPLPALSIMPFGRSIRLNSTPRHARYANVEFTNGAFADASREEVQHILSEFLDQTVDKLVASEILDTNLATIWNGIKSLSVDEREFCELVGSLGHSPGDLSDELATALERIYEILGSRAARDFCLAATSDVLASSARGAESVAAYLSKVRDSELSPLLGAVLPPENYSRPSWLRGMQAAKNLRDKLRIDVKDVMGADNIFERLQIDTTSNVNLPELNDAAALPFSGAIDRSDSTAKVALLQTDQLHRRFGAGRVTYLAWVSEAQSRRLVTNAVTRDQQASRSFAAEILIPQAYLTRLAGSKRELHYDQVREAARERRVMPDVAFKQAHNAGIRVGAI
jgi:hypothetical protein